MPQYQGVWTLEQQAQAQSNQQWVTDPNFKNTTLLLQADGTGSGSQNQTFLDGSTNNFFITRNGNTTQGSFSPFSQAPGYWSNYFDGTDDFYTSSTALFNYTIANASTQTATIEALVYITALQSAPANIWENPCIAGKGDVYMNFGVNASGNLFMYHISGGTARNTISSSTVPLNTWNYVAAVISGGTITLYINGVASGSGTWFGIDAAGQNSTSYFGETPDADSRAWLGYISNLRVSTTARTITVPTSPYVNDGNTAFLTFQSNRVVDNSSNAYAITASGTPSVQAFGPFAPALQWTPDVVGGSGYFDGTGDYLSLADNAALQIGSGDFTLQFWWYPTSLTGFQTPYEKGYVTAGGSLLLQTGNGDGVVLVYINGSTVITASRAITLGAWNYVVLARSGTTLTLYLNGVSVGSATNSTNLNSTDTVGIGSNSAGGTGPGSFSVYGYLSGLRLVKGTALSATTPTSPPTAVANTSLLVNATNAGIYDGKMGCVAETVSTAQVSTNPVKYGTGSIKFNGSTDRLTIKRSDLFDFGTGDFTIESWIYFNSVASIQAFATNYLNSSTGWGWQWRSDTGAWNFGYGDTGLISYTNTPVVGTWIHSAVSRSNNVLRMFVNGVLVSTVTNSTNMSGTTTDLTLGVNPFAGGVQYFNGYLDDFRITKGVGRYTANFTPPQQALPRQ
jgi:hypothetical protein